jgi:DNA polymerase III alpha subunit (gram-positive type)
LVPELPSKRLEYLCQHFNITNERAHRAMEDVMVTVKILENFIHILKERRIEEKFQIIEFQNKPLHKT